MPPVPHVVSIGTAFILCAGLSACNAGGRASSDTPVLSVFPQELHFSAASGQQSDPPPAAVEVNDSGSGVLTFAASSDAGWLAVTPTGGSAPQSLQVSAMVGALAPGTYAGRVLVVSSGARGSPATVTVTFSILPNAKQ